MFARLGILSALVVLPSLASATEPDLAERARAILNTHCQRCHSPEGQAKGGFSYVLDRDRLVARGKVVPGNATDSELLQRIEAGEMPPPGKGPRLSRDEILVLRRWIEAGAPGETARRTRISESAVQAQILADLQALPPRQRRFARYLTLTHLANSGLGDKDLDTARVAVSKLVNSLSWHPRITRPVPIDAARTIFRLDLRQYRWSAALWDRLVSAYPYRLGTTPEARALATASGTELAHLRGDWFVATAARPPFYQQLLQLPSSDRGLERLLQVDVTAALQEESAVRAGFNESGVSRNNRLLERHDAAFGAYWRSYDFAGNTGRQNLFEHPLGPAAGATSFQPAGGEVIFHLPNGLFGYLLTDGGGRSIDRAPVEIVSDPRRPDQRVETGLSCMSCHARGLIFKADQVRAHVEKNPTAFSVADVDAVRALYAPKARLQALLNEDNERYLKALAATGAGSAAQDPVNVVTLRYEGTLDQRTAAAELGLSSTELADRLQQAPTLARVLGPLRLPGGTVQRQVFLNGFAETVRAMRLDEGGIPTAQNTSASPLPFTGHNGTVRCVEIAPDGKRAATGGEDRTLRLWDVSTGRQLVRIEAGAGEIVAMAFTPDGKRLVLAGTDRTIWLLDAATGQELLRLRGHTDRVRALAVSPDGQMLASGGEDHTVRVWAAAGGRELHCLTGHTQPISALAFAADGRLLSAAHDGTLRLWSAAMGTELACFESPVRSIHSVALSPDGRHALSGGSDGTMLLWELDSGRELRRFAGPASAVIRVAFSADGRRAWMGSSRYRAAGRVLREWDLESGRELRALGGDEEVSIGCLALAPDGQATLAGGAGGVLRFWRWSK
jgi:mono/diheme cytochrome c family protein